VPLQNVSDRLIGDGMPEVGERAGNAIVAPAFVLLSHADDQGFEFNSYAGTSRIGAVLRAVELAGDQTAIPGEDGFRFRHTSHVRQPLPTEPLSDLGKRRTLPVRKPESTGDARAEDSILGKEVFALKEQALIDHASHVRQQP
jgi:hypothetical protein